MATIRPEQQNAFQDDADRMFLEKLTGYLRRTEPSAQAPLTDETLARMVANGIARARKHGLTREDSIAGFVALMFQIAPNFDDHPAFRAVLSDESIQPDDRVAAIPKRTRQSDYIEAARNADMMAFFN